ncbi:MAG: iron-containing alcohol dehydrogenase [Breznakia sp.]
MANTFLVPRKIVTGTNALNESGELFTTLGKKACIICDTVMIDLGNVKILCDTLKQHGIRFAIYDKINGEPSDIMIDEGQKFYIENHCDFLIAIGGGSPIDAMKAIAVCVKTKQSINAFYKQKITFEVANMVAIPTTAGTGSEATQFSIITNTQQQIKMLLTGEHLIPDVAILDAHFIQSAPPHIIAATGIDALCHAVESYTSKKAQPLAQTQSISAIKRILKYLPILFKDPKNSIAAVQMSLAALEAGIAFNNASVTIIHGMSRPLGALFHIPHGLSNAMLFEDCMRFACIGQETVFNQLAIDVGFQQNDNQQPYQRFFTSCFALIHNCHIRSISDFTDVDAYARLIPKMSEDALASGSPQNTMRNVRMEDIQNLYRQLFKTI